MEYRFLVSKEVERFFEERPDMSVGEIFRAILNKSFTGIEIVNKGRLTELTDQDWYEAIDKAFNYEELEEQ